MQAWIENNQAPYDDLFFYDLLQEWKRSGNKFDFNDGIARMAFMYSAQVRRERCTWFLLINPFLKGFRIYSSQR